MSLDSGEPNMSADDLEPIAPNDAVDLYLADIQDSKSQWTQYSHRSRLSHFLDWCSESEVENLLTVKSYRK